MAIVTALVFAVLTAVVPRASFDSGIVRVQEYGNGHGRPVLLIPGLACGPWVWEKQIAALSRRYDVYALTLPGFDGRAMIRGDRLMRRAADAIHTLIVTHRLRHAALVGHSLGGTLTVLFAETYPRDASNVITVEGGYPEAATQAERNAAVARDAAPYEHITQAQLPQALKANMLQYTITRPADVNRATQLAGRSDAKAVVAWMKAALSLDLTPKLSAITAPFTAIVPFDAVIDPYRGFKTLAAKRAAYEAWVAHTPNGKLVMITPSRHFVMIDRPRAFEAALESALLR
jgi:pimeloyl-ACP methyl ester carboxylesterase